MTRPRAADDFATIRARMEELRRDRAEASDDEPRDAGRTGSVGRNLMKASDGRQRVENDRWPGGGAGRKYASGR